MVRAERNSLIGTKKSVRLLLYLPVIIMAWVERNSPTDLDIYLNAARDYYAGINPYTQLYHQWYHYYYSQAFALLLAFPSLAYRPAVHMLWMLLQFYFAEKSFYLLKQQASTLTGRHLRTFSVVVVLASLRFVYENLHYGQVSLMLVWLCLKSLQSIQQNKALVAGSFLATGINVKILPLPAWLLLFLRRQWRTLFFSLSVLVVLWLLPMMYTGFSRWQEMNYAHWELINPIKPQHLQDTEEDSFHSITTFLSVFLTEQAGQAGQIHHKRNVANLDATSLAIAIQLARALLFISLLWIMFRTHEKRKQHIISTEEWYFMMFLIPMTFPHQQHYAFIFIIPLFSLLLAQMLIHTGEGSPWKKTGWYFLMIPALLWSLKLFLGEFNPWYEHYKLLTWAAFWLWLVSLMKIKSFQAPPVESGIE